jgi:hypothetical protein
MKLKKINFQEDGAIYYSKGAFWEVKDCGLSKVIVNRSDPAPITDYYFLCEVLEMKFERVLPPTRETPRGTRVFMKDDCGLWRTGRFDSIATNVNTNQIIYMASFDNDSNNPMRWDIMIPIDFTNRE